MALTLSDQPQIGSGNPVLDEIDRAHAGLSDHARQALESAHQSSIKNALGGIPAATPPSSASPDGPLLAYGDSNTSGTVTPKSDDMQMSALKPTIGTQQPTRMPSMTPDIDQGPIRSSTIPTQLQPQSFNQQRFSQLTSGPSSGLEEKINGIQNPFLKGLARVGGTAADVVASGLFPNFGQFVPGTSAHHGLLVHQAQNAVANDENQQKSAADLAKTQAETNLETEQTKNLANKGKDTIETDQGVIQWNPDTQRYDINAGKTPIKEGAAKVETDVNGNLIQVASDGTAKPVTMNGVPVKGKQPEVSRPLTKQMADAQNAIWNATAQKHGLPPNQFHEGMSADDAKTITNGLSTVIGKQQGDTHITIARDNADTKASAAQDKDTRKAAHELANSYRKDFSAAQSQLDTLDQAKAEINSGAVGQAVGTIKTIVALAGGKGSGVRVTNPELNSIVHSRGFKGDFDVFLQKFDTGKPLAPDQVKEITSVLDLIKSKAAEKESRLNDVLDKLQNATTKDDVNKIDSEYRKGSLHGGSDTSQGKFSVIDPNGKEHPFDTQEQANEFKKRANIK
jgi:hypothetical protein